MNTDPGRTVYRCNNRTGGDTWATSRPCPNALDPTDEHRGHGMPAIEAAARAAGWGVWNGRLYGIGMGPVFTCPDCKRGGR